MPKYRRTGRIKEFAFVEFDDKDSVDRCLNAFRQFNGVIADTYDAEKLKSVQSYIKEQDEVEEIRSNSVFARDIPGEELNLHKILGEMKKPPPNDEDGSASDDSDTDPPTKKAKIGNASDSGEESPDPKTTDGDGDDEESEAHSYIKKPAIPKKVENEKAKK